MTKIVILPNGDAHILWDKVEYVDMRTTIQGEQAISVELKDIDVTELSKVYDNAVQLDTLRERDLRDFWSDTAKDCYNKLSMEDKARMQSLIKYTANYCILMQDGKDWIRSYGLLKFPWKRQEKYHNGVWYQINDEAKRVERFNDDGKLKNSEYIAWSKELREQIFTHFSSIRNSLSEEIKGMQIARQMMGISWWIWTNKKTSSADARGYKLLPGHCSRCYFNVVFNDMSVVGLDNLQQEE